MKRLAMLAAALGLLALPVAAQAAQPSYVALGDSYTAGALVLPFAPNAPLECTQSAVNYPHLAAQALGLSLNDRSCSGATTANMTTSQFPGVAPQFAALNAGTSVVTMSISGNDNGLFGSAIVLCGALDIADFFNIGTPCRSTFGNMFANEVASDGPTVGAAIAQIHTLAPNAKVFVVGYPDILPASGNCYPQIPLTTGDVAYMAGVEIDVNAMLAAQAAANGATFVDTYASSSGHDACQPESTRWIEPPIPGTDAAPMHPNAAGEVNDAVQVEAAMRSAGL